MTRNGNLYADIEASLASNAGDVALALGDGLTTTNGALAELVARMASVLTHSGVGPGDRVTSQAQKSPPALALYLATLKIGAVFNPLNTAYVPAELEHFIADVEPKVVVASAARLAEIGDLARRHGAAALMSMEPDGAGELSDRALTARAHPKTAERGPGDLAALLYTSGTTGRSKGAMITHGNLASNARALIGAWGLTRGETLIHTLPIYHVHGLFVAANTALIAGLPMAWRPNFDVREVLELLKTSRVMMGVPTFYTRLLAEPELSREGCRSMRLFVAGSAPLLPGTHRAFIERTGHAILERYGMTETGMIASNPLNGERVAGSVGYALPGVSVRVVDASGRELPRGDTGGVEVKGPNVFKGYWRLPEQTVREFRGDGYFITGDQGVMAEGGRLSLVGRAKDLIITGGLNVYPIEIEQALNGYPGIAESAVIGVPHPDFGEGVVAIVQPSDPSSPPGEPAVIADLSRRLAKFKCPKRVLCVDALPRNAMGKVQKAELRKTYSGLFEMSKTEHGS
jgi:malonyl-CoA/methylmalonyl-CoA synthetase